MRMPGATTLMPAQIPIEYRADMIKLMKNGYEFVFECLILKSGQTKSDQIINFPTIHIILLYFVITIPPFALKITTFKPHGGNSCLQAMQSEIPSSGDRHQNFIGIEIKKLRTVLRYVGYQLQHSSRKIKRAFNRSRLQPWGRIKSNFSHRANFFAVEHDHRHRDYRIVPLQNCRIMPHAIKRL